MPEYPELFAAAARDWAIHNAAEFLQLADMYTSHNNYLIEAEYALFEFLAEVKPPEPDPPLGSRRERSKQPIPAALRWEIWERDEFTCAHCGTHRHLTIDHIVPESAGGTLDPQNLQTLCRSCNSRKGVSQS